MEPQLGSHIDTLVVYEMHRYCAEATKGSLNYFLSSSLKLRKFSTSNSSNIFNSFNYFNSLDSFSLFACNGSGKNACPLLTSKYPLLLRSTTNASYATIAGAAPSSPEKFSPNEEELAKMLKQHEIHERSLLPVRREFAADHPLITIELEAIDIMEYHRETNSIRNLIAYGTVRFLRFFADTFFRKRYVHRAVVLETVAAVPGMVAGMFRHLRCLRKIQNDGGWISRLLHEAENERMHLMIWMQISQPSLPERILITLVQGLFSSFYSFFYIVSPVTAHRMVGYLEEEAVISYTGFLHEIDNGNIKNSPAPRLAIDYYNLSSNSTLRDVVLAVRADEAAHRDANHHFADRMLNRNEDLKTEFHL